MAQFSELPYGAKIKFGKYSVEGETAQDIVWIIVDKSTPSAITLLTEKVIDIRMYDAPELTHTDTYRKGWGNNRYSQSNIDQWLNKDSPAGQWYVAKHSMDSSPSAGTVPYANRPGFLNAFTASEKDVIMNTTITCVKPTFDGGGTEQITRKVFLPSRTELKGSQENDIYEGTKWREIGYPYVPLTTQAYNNTKSTSKGTSGAYIAYYTRTPQFDSEYMVRTMDTSGAIGGTRANNEGCGIRPALNVPSNLTISNTTDSDGCYRFIINNAPPSPATLTLPSKIYGGKNNTISWSSVVDADGNTVTYQLECSYDKGGTYSTLYIGQLTSYVHLVPFDTATVMYRVKAFDPSNASSAYKTSAVVTVVNNYAPVISGTDSNLGVKSAGFTGTYTISDANSDAVTVTEAIDGVQIRTLMATLGTPITFGVTENTWLALPNGSHTLTIRATDGIDTSVRTYTFTKLVDSFTIQNSTPWASSTMPSRIMLVITRNIPSASTFKVEVCNNGNDASPTWEDCTDAVRSGLVHVFTNTTKTASNWGVLVRVTVARNGATGACYISAIGGNFE